MAIVTVGSSPGQLDITGIRGDKWGPLECTPRVGLDLSGRTWLAQVRATKDRPASVIATFVVDSTDADTGVLRLTLLPAQTALLVTPHPLPGQKSVAGKGVYFWDLQATLVADATDVKTWFAGKIIVDGDVSGSF